MKQENKEILNRFAVNLNDRAKAGKLDPVIGRDEEIRRVLQIKRNAHRCGGLRRGGLVGKDFGQL